MKKLLTICLTLLISSCSTQMINQTVLSDKKAEIVSKVADKSIKLSFKLKDVAVSNRVKSIDAYLIKDINNPLASNVYTNSFKYQADVVDGVINISFSNFSPGGPYYVAIQVFDNVISSATRNNITAFNSSNTQIAISKNNLSFDTNTLTYSDGSNAFNVSIDLIPFNSLPVNLSPQDGDKNQNNNITLG